MEDDVVQRVRAISDPIEQALEAAEQQSAEQQTVNELARIRREALEKALTTLGISQVELARRVGITKGRLTQILKGGNEL